MAADYETQNSNVGNGSPATCPLTIPSVLDRLLLIGMQANSGPVVSSPTFAGQALTLIHRSFDLMLYYLLNPPVGANNFNANLDVTADWCAGAVLLKGVNQSTPLGTFDFDTNDQGLSVQADVSTVVGGLVADVAFMVHTSMSAFTGQTRRVNRDSFNGSVFSLGMSTKPGTGGTVSMRWDASASVGDNSVIAVPVIPSAGAAGVSVVWLRA